MFTTNKTKNLITIIMFLISISIIVYFCIDNNNLLTLIAYFKEINYFWLLIALTSMFFTWYFDSKILYEIIDSVYKNISNKYQAFQITMTGYLFGAITPFGFGSQPAQILKMHKIGIKTGKAISILIRKFLIYQTVVSIYSLIIILTKFHMLNNEVTEFLILTLIGFGNQCLIIAFLGLFSINQKFTTNFINFIIYILSKIKIIKNINKVSENIQSQLITYDQNNKEMRKNKKLTLKLYFYAFLELTFLYAIPFFIYRSFNYTGFPIIDMIATQSFVTMISSYTPLPGSSGTTEQSFITLFSHFFTDKHIMPSMILCRFITYYLGILFSFIVIKIPYKRSYNKKVSK